MNAHTITSILFIPLVAYNLLLIRACLLMGEEIGGPSAAKHYQDAITPPSSSTQALVSQIGFLISMIMAFVNYGWIIGIVIIPASLIAVVVAQKFLPRAESPHFRNKVMTSLRKRYAEYLKQNDTVRAQAIQLLLEKLTQPCAQAVENTYKS